ncbi:MAG: M20/M25/M40 family metallo-hydrolase [Acidobacteria bacterium]|nr:M20/M25/M40 family metallo-hydrolase [Acidobacteriota bacterium]
MRTVLIAVFSLVLTSSLLAQAPSPTPQLYSAGTLSAMERIRDHVLASDYGYRQVAYLSNNIGARLSGSPQAAKAVEYVAAELRKLGLDVRLQKCMVPHWVRGEERAEIVSWPGMTPATTQNIVLTTLGGSVATPPEGVTADIVVVQDFEELERLGRGGVAGKIVLFNHKFDTAMANSGFGLAAYGDAVQYRFAGAIAAAKLGAVAALVRSAGANQNRLAHTGSMGYEDGVPKVPAASVSFEDAETLAWLAKEGKVRVHLTLRPQTLPDVESYNVIADLKGTERPDEIVIVSGHLDSWDTGRGAIDDAAGVAAAMSVPAALKALGLRPKRTIRVIAWMNEENGGRGSAAYAEAEKGNYANHFAAIEADLGASHPLGFSFAGDRNALAYLQPISKVLSAQGAGLSQWRDGVGADISPLTRQGVPSFAPWFDERTYFNYHHTAADTLDKVIPEEFAQNASLVSVLAYGLANIERPLPR